MLEQVFFNRGNTFFPQTTFLTNITCFSNLLLFLKLPGLFPLVCMKLNFFPVKIELCYIKRYEAPFRLCVFSSGHWDIHRI